jgi:hypothetical protein
MFKFGDGLPLTILPKLPAINIQLRAVRLRASGRVREDETHGYVVAFGNVQVEARRVEGYACILDAFQR